MVFIGLDGGGSTVRVAAYTRDMTELAQVVHPNSVNPSTIGRELAAQRIHVALNELLAAQDVSADAVRGVGVGISGADTAHSRSWILETVHAVLPGVAVVPSADYEIALVAAHGERYGALLLAGTGSVAYGVNRDGKSHRVGGWGYQIGDEGSGYWLGASVLRLLAQVSDGRHPPSELAEKARTHLKLKNPINDLIDWVYGGGVPRNQEIAGLASLIIDAAGEGDMDAQVLVAKAASDIQAHYTAIVNVLGLRNAPIGFAGGMLTTDNALSRAVMARLGLDTLPTAKYPPVAGAALLAALTLENK